MTGGSNSETLRSEPISLSGLPFPGGTDFRPCGDRAAIGFGPAKINRGNRQGPGVQVSWREPSGPCSVARGNDKPAAPLDRGRISRFGNEVGLTVTLSKDDVPLKVWSANKSLPAGKEKEGQAAAEEALIDEAICELAIYIKENDASPANNGKANMVDATKPLSARALAELKKGRRSLERYARTTARTTCSRPRSTSACWCRTAPPTQTATCS